MAGWSRPSSASIAAAAAASGPSCPFIAMVPMRTLRRTSSTDSPSSAATAAASSSAPGSTRRIAVQRSSFGSIRILESRCAVSVAMLRGCCKGLASSVVATPWRYEGALRGCCSRDPTVLLGRGDESAATEPDHCRSATSARSTPDEPIWMAQGDSSQTSRGWNREKDHALMTFITKRRLASLVSASAMVATLAVASMPVAALAAKPAAGATPSTTRVPQRLRESQQRHVLRVRQYGDVRRDPRRLGTSGITAASGSWYATAAQGTPTLFTRFGGYSNTFPTNGYTTSVDVYLDVTRHRCGQFEWSSAISDTSGAHRRDFIFHVGTSRRRPVPGERQQQRPPRRSGRF